MINNDKTQTSAAYPEVISEVMSVSNYCHFFQAFVNTACLIAVAFQLGHVLQVTEIFITVK